MHSVQYFSLPLSLCVVVVVDVVIVGLLRDVHHSVRFCQVS